MKLYLLGMLILPICVAIGQKNIPDFGKIDKQDLLLKDCEFDNGAEAYKLLDLGAVHYENGKFIRMQMDRRVRIKILKEKGLNNANVKIRYFNVNNYEYITGLSGVTYNLDLAGNVVTTKLDKAAIFTRKVDSHQSEIVFTLPDVKIGSVIEYKYSDSKESITNLRDWYFQDEIPTRFSQYTVAVPEMFKFASNLLTYQEVEKTTGRSNGRLPNGGRMYRIDEEEKTFTLRNIPALKEEPYMGSTADYLERISFQLSRIEYANSPGEDILSTWPKVSKELLDDENFGAQIKKNIPGTGELDNQLNGVQGNYQKMKLIYDYVRKNMSWNGAQSIFSGEGVRSAWDKKSGSNGEINLILLNLLRDAGIKARPLLVSTRDNGTVNPIYPFMEQFNEVLAYVSLGEQIYVLNASDKYNPARLIPYDVINTQGFLVDRDNSAWVTLSNDKELFKTTSIVVATIDDKGKMEGNAIVYSFDYSKNQRVKKWKASRESFEDYFTKEYTGLKIDSMEVNNADNDTLPLEQKLQFSMPLNTSGDFSYFSINLFAGLEKNPFIADKRFTDIDFGCNQLFTISGRISLPENMTLEELPKDILMITPDTGIVLKRMLQVDDNALTFRITVEFKKPVYYAGDYDNFKEFYKVLFDKLNEQIVLKKKV